MKTRQSLRPRQLSVSIGRELFQRVVGQHVSRQRVQFGDRSSDLNVLFETSLGDLIGEILSMFFG